jgi:hypothetical protein
MNDPERWRRVRPRIFCSEAVMRHGSLLEVILIAKQRKPPGLKPEVVFPVQWLQLIHVMNGERELQILLRSVGTTCQSLRRAACRLQMMSNCNVALMQPKFSRSAPGY